MASPLTRMRVSSTGGLYTRPPLVEAEIDHVMTFPPAERRRRGKVQDRTSGDYLRSETLVHLLRADLRQGGDGTPYLQTLIKRCEGNPLLQRFSAEDIVREIATHSQAFERDPQSAFAHARAQIVVTDLSRQQFGALMHVCVSVLEADGVRHPAEERTLEQIALLRPWGHR